MLRNLSLRYSAEGELALNNFSLEIGRGTRVAIVGRTGSGKSSLLQALYRLTEPEPSSTYRILGRDALAMPLGALRGLFTCIPQAPFFFGESLRANLDPSARAADADVLGALAAVQMLETVQRVTRALRSSAASAPSTKKEGFR